MRMFTRWKTRHSQSSCASCARGASRFPRHRNLQVHDSGAMDLRLRTRVALPAREARVGSLAIEICRCTTQERWIYAFERVDADNGVEMAVDPAGDDRHDAAL